MKYLILAGQTYYPTGAEDAKSSKESLVDAKLEAHKLLTKDQDLDWVEVLDTDTLEIEYIGVRSYSYATQSEVTRFANNWEEYCDNKKP